MRTFTVVVNGSAYEVAIEEVRGQGGAAPAPVPAAVTPAPRAQAPAPASPAPSAAPAKEGGEGTVVAPMPGTIADIDVNVGDQVVWGQKLMILEAMKMENEIVSHRDGVVSEIRVSPGALVNTGDVLAIVS